MLIVLIIVTLLYYAVLVGLIVLSVVGLLGIVPAFWDLFVSTLRGTADLEDLEFVGLYALPISLLFLWVLVGDYFNLISSRVKTPICHCEESRTRGDEAILCVI